MPISLIEEMMPLSALSSPSFPEESLEVSLIIPARRSAQSLAETVQAADRFLKESYNNSYEIILVPNPAPGDTSDLSIQLAEELSRKFSSVRVFPHALPPGKGAAVRTGFSHSRGKWIFLTDADLPYELSFFQQAIEKLQLGFDLVTGNRRLPSSHFWVPVRLLPLTYGRHRLGLAFNRMVRWCLPISTTDTQAGIKAISRRLALEAFTRQKCPGFLYDLEIFLTAHGHGFRQIHLPVTLNLNSEKSTVRILRESILVFHWLTRITWRNLRGAYSPRKNPKTLLSRYPGVPVSTRLFLLARWVLTPYFQMTAYLPVQGNLLDLGCGHGLFALAAILQCPARNLLGIDHDENRVRLGAKATEEFPQVHIKQGDLIEFPMSSNSYAGIAMIDVLHYFNPQTQEKILRRALDSLSPKGILLVREVEPNTGVISSWNRVYEKIATRIGFTQSNETELYFRSRQAWCDLLQKIGFKVTWKHCSSLIFSDILFICEKP